MTTPKRPQRARTRHLHLVATAILLFTSSCRDESGGVKRSTEDSAQVPTANGVGAVDTTDAPMVTTSGRGFGGYWIWSNDREGLSLDLVQEGARVSGHHEAWEQYGDKVDMVGDDEISSINGTIQSGVVTVTFRSGVSGMVGKGRLTMRGDQLQWEITTAAGGECYIPRSALLHRAPSDDEERPQLDEGAEAQRAEREARPAQRTPSSPEGGSQQGPTTSPSSPQKEPSQPE